MKPSRILGKRPAIIVMVESGQELLAAGGCGGSCSDPFRSFHVPLLKPKRSLALRASQPRV